MDKMRTAGLDSLRFWSKFVKSAKKKLWNETALSLNQIICKSALALDEDQWPKLFLLKKKR